MSIIAETIKGINIVIGAETKALTASLADINKSSKNLQAELKEVDKLLKFDPRNTELLAQKQKLLGAAVGTTKTKLDALKTAQAQVNAQFAKGDISEGQYRAFQREISSTTQSLKKLETQGENTHKVLSKENAVKAIKSIGMAAGAAALAIGAMFVGMANRAIENADELMRLSDVTGLTTERLQELKYAGQNLGVEIETVTGAQTKLTKAMYAAKDGTGAQAEAFATLGIAATDSNGQLRDAKTVMEEAFTALNGVGNETERDALSMQLFGKSAMELNPLIKAGGEELRRLTEEGRANGSVMSNEAVAGLDAFGDSMTNIKTSILGSFGEMFADLLPKILGFVDDIIAYWNQLKNGLSSLQSENEGFFAAISVIWSDIVASVRDAIDQITAFWDKWGPTIIAIIKPIFETVGVVIKTAMQLIGEIIALVLDVMTGDWEGAGENIKRIAQTIWDGLKGIFQGLSDTLGAIWYGIRTAVTDTLVGLAQDAISLGANIIQGLIDGFTNKLEAAKQAALNVAGNINQALRDFFDVKSPSQVMADLGANLIQGLADGINNNKEAEAAMQRVATAIKDVVTSMSGELEQAFALTSASLDLQVLKLGEDATEADKLRLSLQELAAEQTLITGKIDILNAAYLESKNRLGEDAEETKKYWSELQKLHISLDTTGVKMSNVTKKLMEQLSQFTLNKDAISDLNHEMTMLNGAYDIQEAAMGDNASEQDKLNLKLKKQKDTLILLAKAVDLHRASLDLARSSTTATKEEVQDLEEALLAAQVAYAQAESSINSTTSALNDQAAAINSTTSALNDQATAAVAAAAAIASIPDVSDEHDSPTFVRPPSGAQPDISDDEINSTWAQSLRGTFRMLLREKINGTDSPDNSLYAKINNATTREAWKTFDKYAANAWMGQYGFAYGGALADGGIVNQPSLRLIAEAGESEVVSPLSKLLPMMVRAFQVAKSTGGGGISNSLQTANNYNFAPGSIIIPAKDLAEMRTIQDFFNRFPQVVRAMGV